MLSIVPRVHVFDGPHCPTFQAANVAIEMAQGPIYIYISARALRMYSAHVHVVTHFAGCGTHP